MARTVTEIVADYKTFADAMLGPNSTQEKLLLSLKDVFDLWQLSNEQMGEVMGTLISSVAASYNKDALTAATDWETKEEQALLLARQAQGYDDNMLLKIVEHQAGLASFAVNAGSKTAQEPIDLLIKKMTAVEERVPRLDGQPNCPVLPTVVAIPTNVIVTNATETAVDLAWDPALNATQYLVYRDGVLSATTDLLTHTDTPLVGGTKYVYSVKASIDGLLSGYSDMVSVTTVAPTP